MSQGFLAVNNNNQVLISQDTRNLHFVGKATMYNTVNSFTDYGGLRQITFRITCKVAPVPFFTMPTTDFYGVTAIRQIDSSTWEIELIISGTSSLVPEVYVFADPRAFGSSRDSNYGLVVYASDGTPAFDSRLSPLVVAGGLSVTHPSNPKPVFSYGLDPRFCGSSSSSSGPLFAPDQYNSYSVSVPSKPMYFFPSLAQSEREASYSADETKCDGASVKGNCIGAERNHHFVSTYWAFYRGGIRYTGSSLDAGWIVVAWGCNWTEQTDTNFTGIGTGGSSGSGGSWPYSNETINLSAASVIIGNASIYD